MKRWQSFVLDMWGLSCLLDKDVHWKCLGSSKCISGAYGKLFKWGIWMVFELRQWIKSTRELMWLKKRAEEKQSAWETVEDHQLRQKKNWTV